MPPRATEEELRAIYRETILPLYASVSRRCGGDRPLAEDVTQETWLRAVRAWRHEGVPERPLAWLVTVARNLLRNHFRRRRPVSLDTLTAQEVLAAVDAEGPPGGEGLPDEQAGLLEAFHFERRRVAQIAQARGLSERAVEGRLRRARGRLRREIEALLAANGESP
jgi:RNA polymerase sigma-70 factor, ECF subfamily